MTGPEPSGPSRQRRGGSRGPRVGRERRGSLVDLFLKPPRERSGELGVAVDPEARVPSMLPQPSRLHRGADRRRRLALALLKKLALGEPRHRQLDVDPVEQRTGELLPVLLDPVLGAIAADRSHGTRTGRGWPR